MHVQRPATFTIFKQAGTDLSYGARHLPHILPAVSGRVVPMNHLALAVVHRAVAPQDVDLVLQNG